MKNIQRFAPIKYNDYFLISTVLNAAISGDTVEAILYRVESCLLYTSDAADE